MDNALKLLCDDYLENAPNLKAFDEAYDFFEPYADSNKVFDILSAATDAEAEQAFYAGFRTAVKLLIGGNDNERNCNQ